MRFEDISFTNEETYVLFIDTNLYSGNFEREITKYCIGTCHSEYSEDYVEQTDNPIVKSLQNLSTTELHEEYGRVSCAIATTPGRINDGFGNHRDAEPGEEGYSAFESVGIFLSELPNTEQLEYVKKRALEYAEIYNQSVAKTDNSEMLEIKDVYMVSYTTIINEHRF